MIFDITDDNYTLFEDSTTIARYLLGGKGIVTLVAPSGKAHRYAFERPKDESAFQEGTIFVYALHEGHKFYLGKYTNTYFNLTRASSFNADTEAVKGAMYIARMAREQALVDSTPMKLYYANTCAYCGAKLSTKKALKIGMGRVCIKKFNEKMSKVKYNGNNSVFAEIQ